MVYQAVPGLLWVQEAGGILVVNPATGAAQTLSGQAAAVWDWLNSGHPGAEVARLLALTYDLAEPEAQAALEHWVRQWQAEGLVEATPD